MNPETTFMAMALDLARKALADGDFPVGCVIADAKTVIAQGRRTGTGVESANEIDHAEINALRQLCAIKTAADHSKLTLYCTMEPCLMCFAAILLSGIKRIVFAYEDVMGGGTGCDRTALPALYRNAELTVTPGILRQESLMLFHSFFSDPGNTYWADSVLSRYTLAQVEGP